MVAETIGDHRLATEAAPVERAVQKRAVRIEGIEVVVLVVVRVLVEVHPEVHHAVVTPHGALAQAPPVEVQIGVMVRRSPPQPGPRGTLRTRRSSAQGDCTSGSDAELRRIVGGLPGCRLGVGQGCQEADG